MKSFEHRFIPSPIGASHGLLLLHGTGGNEDSLLELGATLDPGAALLSPRGKVSEDGAPRFFRRFSEGVFDLEDVRHRAAELAAWVHLMREEHGLRQLTAVGFSNGANIGNSMLLLHPESLDGVLSIRGQKIFRPQTLPNLTGKRALLLQGETDPIVPRASAFGLAEVLSESGAEVDLRWMPVGHTLTRQDVLLGKEWLAVGREAPIRDRAFKAADLPIKPVEEPSVGAHATWM